MYIAGLDVGTTGCKIVVYNEDAALLKTYYKEYNVMHKNGQHEIDFADVRDGVLGLLSEATKDYRIDALGVTSFGETFALLDEGDNILAPSMLYTDTRGDKECEEFSKSFGEDKLTLLTGVKPNCMYSIYKIKWLKNNKPDIFAKTRRILLGEDFIVYTLTGKAQIDYSLAARTAAFDIEKKCFVKEIFDALDIDVSLMSKPVEAGSVAGNITPEIKSKLGIDYDITIVNGSHDQVTGMIGSSIFDKTQAMDGTGTVECIPVILDSKPENLDFYEGGYSVVPYIDGKYACYALSFTGGATLKWFRDNFAENEHKMAEAEGKNVYAELDRAVPNGPTGILVLPHFAGAANPYMDPDAKAAFVGITLETTKYDLYKALMEGTSFEMLLNFNTMREQTGDIEQIKATGGGATSDVWLQIKADVLGMDVMALSCKEVGAAGTAALAGVAIGAYKDLKETTEKMSVVRKVFSPDEQNREKYSAIYKNYKNLYKAIKGL